MKIEKSQENIRQMHADGIFSMRETFIFNFVPSYY